MKQQILQGSVGLVIAASTVGTLAALIGTDAVIITKLVSVASVLGLGSIGLFFIGLVYPKD